MIVKSIGVIANFVPHPIINGDRTQARIGFMLKLIGKRDNIGIRAGDKGCWLQKRFHERLPNACVARDSVRRLCDHAGQPKSIIFPPFKAADFKEKQA